MAKLRIVNRGPIPLDEMERQAETNRGLGHVDALSGVPVASGPLAVVGGGPSTAENIEVLRNWKGAIWAINGTWKWCRDRGIDAIFFTIDPCDIVLPYIKNAGCKRAVLATHCHPIVFEELCKTAAIIAFDHNAMHGPITATAAPVVAAKLGHSQVHFFGCEGSFDDRSHIDRNADFMNRMVVSCGGKSFNTTAEFMIGLENLAPLLRLVNEQVPGFCVVHDKGLLSQMMETPEWECEMLTRHLAASVNVDKEAAE